ncbi:uncharacterized protein LOC128677898 [Plodia interpunctella]|uniref:uncharacterized protein LOC128677898 n=1 Tax=Plodia interpunctella TaxID=58824 RepID=UPI003100CAE9
MGMSAKEKSRRYREKLKADPQKYEERKRKKRESYHKNKRLVSDLQPEEKKICRTIWKLRKQNQRQRKKAIENILADTPPSSPIVLQEINVPQDYNNCECTPPASPSSRVSTPVSKERGRKKIRRDRTKMYKENLCLQHETEMWKKKYEKYKKRAHRKEKEIIKLREKKEKETEIERNKYKTFSNAIKEHYSLLKNRRSVLGMVTVGQQSLFLVTVGQQSLFLVTVGQQSLFLVTFAQQSLFLVTVGQQSLFLESLQKLGRTIHNKESITAMQAVTLQG